MEIRSFCDFSASFKDNTSSNSIINVSPDGNSLCRAFGSTLSFLNSENTTSIALALHPRDTISCIETVFIEPWVQAVGTTMGAVHFIDQNKWVFALTPINAPLLKLRVCSYRNGRFTQTYPVLMAFYPPDMAIIPLSSVQSKMNNLNEEVQINRWHIHHSFIDAVLINSSLSSIIVSGLHQFPAVFSIGSNPFLTVSSVQKPAQPKATEIVKQAASRFFRWVKGSTPEDEVPPIPKSLFEWCMKDEGRTAKLIEADPTGRWVALTDNNGRVLIVDSVFGHIVKVLKGLRDSQIGWADGPNQEPFLIIYSPFRKMIIACSVPNGEIFDAVKADSSGRLFSIRTIRNTVAFLDSNMNLLLFDVNCTAEKKIKEINENETHHFLFPPFLSTYGSDWISLLSHSTKENELCSIIPKIEFLYQVPTAIRIILSMHVDSSYLLQFVKESANKFGVPKYNDSKAELIGFFENHKTSDTQLNEEFIFKSYYELSLLWEQYDPKRRVNSINDDNIEQRLSSIIKSEISEPEEILLPSKIPLESYLLAPLNDPHFLFSPILENPSIETICSLYRISMSDREEFVRALVEWVLYQCPTVLLHCISAISSFSEIPTAKIIIESIVEQMPSETVNEIALHYLMS